MCTQSNQPLASELRNRLLTISTLTTKTVRQIPDEQQINEVLKLAKVADPTLTQHLQQMLWGTRGLLTSDHESSCSTLSLKLPVLAPSVDWGFARQTGLLYGTITLILASLVYAAGSFIGEMAALAITMFSLIVGSMLRPQMMAPFLLKGIIVGSIIAAGYRLAIFPHIHNTGMVVMSILPFLLVGTLARASTIFRLPALDACMAFLLGSQAMLTARGAPSAMCLRHLIS